MQTLPIIISIVCAVVVIVAVLLWRVQPQQAADETGLNKRLAEEKQRVEALQEKLEAKENALRTAEKEAAGANATADGANKKAVHAEQQYLKMYDEHAKLRQDYDTAAKSATASQKDAEHLHEQISQMSRTLETYQLQLKEQEAQLNTALAKQQTGTEAVRQFESISQAVLKETLAEAKRGMGEIASELKQSGDKELEKHAEKVAQTLAPLQQKLAAYDAAVSDFQKDASVQFGGLKELLETLQKTEHSLHTQAEALTQALSATPKYRGNYGELALRRLVESVGMVDKCHFHEQVVSDTEEGRKIPDMIISMPGEQKVIVDSKAVLNACTDAYMTQDETQRNKLFKEHCNNVRSRVQELASKNYYANHPNAVETVILFLPAETLYLIAMQHDPEITEFATKNKVIICGPNSLIMLLHVANHLWRQSSIEKEVDDIRKCGNDIYKACCTFVERFSTIGNRIHSLEEEYNKAVGTLEGPLLRAGKRMGGFASISDKKENLDVPIITSNLREFKPSTRQLATTSELPGIIAPEDKTQEFAFVAPEEVQSSK